MKVSLNWVKEFIEIDLSPDELVEKIGGQLGAVDEVENIGARYKGIVVVEVMDSQKHPNADKLSVCKVDDGGVVKGVDRQADGLVQIVCGAPNVHAGMLAAWIPPASVVPSTVGKDPFTIEAREIRGQLSNGMLASAKELGFGDSHEGLLEIDEKVKPGSNFADVYKLDDHIIDIENKMFTHRPDCFGILGVAREIAGIGARSYKSPDWYTQEGILPSMKATRLTLSASNEVPDVVPRLCLLPIAGVKVEPSPVWLQSKLSRVGIKPINNIVDITNFFMMETGQPLHAYDYDKLQTGKIGVRLSKAGETLKLLSGKELKLDSGSPIITDGEKPIGLAGVMGGADTEVDDRTKNIVLECGTFNMNTTRKSSMTYGLFTDAATRFTKGQSPLQNRAVIAKAADDIIRLAGGGLGGELLDVHSGLPSLAKLSLNAGFINERLGLNLKSEQIEKILTNVEFKVVRQKDSLEVTAPFWRMDIEIAEDIVEEVGRLHGYDYLPVNLPNKDLSPAKRDTLLDFKDQLRQHLSSAGANELLTYSFVHGSLLVKSGQSTELAYQLRNALSPDLQYYRLSLMPSLLEKIHPNIKQGFGEFALYELGKSHNQKYPTDNEEKVPKQFNMLALVVAASGKNASTQSGAAFYGARAYLDFLSLKLGITFKYECLTSLPDYPVAKPYDFARSAAVSVAETGTGIGMVGEFRPEVVAGLKLPNFCAGFEIGIEELLACLPAKRSYTNLSRFPVALQDITLKTPSSVSFGQLFERLTTLLEELKPKNSLAGLSPTGIYQKGKSDKNFSFHLTIAHHDKTLKAEEVNALLDSLASQVGREFGAQRV